MGQIDMGQTDIAQIGTAQNGAARSSSACRVTAGSYPGAAVYHVQGELDSATAGDARAGLAAAVGEATVLLELSGVGFIDTVGLGALLGVVRRIHEAGGLVAISEPRAGVMSVLLMAGVDRLVFIADSAAAAAAWISGPDTGGQLIPDGR